MLVYECNAATLLHEKSGIEGKAILGDNVYLVLERAKPIHKSPKPYALP